MICSSLDVVGGRGGGVLNVKPRRDATPRSNKYFTRPFTLTPRCGRAEDSQGTRAGEEQSGRKKTVLSAWPRFLFFFLFSLPVRTWQLLDCKGFSIARGEVLVITTFSSASWLEKPENYNISMTITYASVNTVLLLCCLKLKPRYGESRSIFRPIKEMVF